MSLRAVAAISILNFGLFLYPPHLCRVSPNSHTQPTCVPSRFPLTEKPCSPHHASRHLDRRSRSRRHHVCRSLGKQWHFPPHRACRRLDKQWHFPRRRACTRLGTQWRSLQHSVCMNRDRQWHSRRQYARRRHLLSFNRDADIEHMNISHYCSGVLIKHPRIAR